MHPCVIHPFISLCTRLVFMQRDWSACFLYYCQINLTVLWALCSVNHLSSGAEAWDNFISNDLIRYIPARMDARFNACIHIHTLCVCVHIIQIAVPLRLPSKNIFTFLCILLRTICIFIFQVLISAIVMFNNSMVHCQTPFSYPWGTASDSLQHPQFSITEVFHNTQNQTKQSICLPRLFAITKSVELICQQGQRRHQICFQQNMEDDEVKKKQVY